MGDTMDGASSFLMGVWSGAGQTHLGECLESRLQSCLGECGLSLSSADVQELTESRLTCLAENSRIEFGEPAVALIAEALASSPWMFQENLKEALFGLQQTFYLLRDEIPIDVPDEEIVEGLRGCFDACEGDAFEVSCLSAEDVLRFSGEYRRERAAANADSRQTPMDCACQVIDGDGNVYALDPEAWSYDEFADGWDGEKWGGDLDD